MDHVKPKWPCFIQLVSSLKTFTTSQQVQPLHRLCRAERGTTTAANETGLNFIDNNLT